MARLLSDLAFRFRALFEGAEMERDLDEEFSFHLEKHAEQLVSKGMDPEEARRKAHQHFGSVARQRDNVRWSWGLRWVGQLVSELGVIGRQMRRARGFTMIVTLTLALGLGGSAAVYTLLDRVVLDPLPYPDADRLVSLTNQVPGVGEGAEWNASTAQYVHFSEEAASLESVGLYRGYGANIETPEGPQRAQVLRTTASLLSLLGARAQLGRSLTANDDRPDGPPVAVLSHGFWTRQFGADVGVVGRVLSIGGNPFEIIGVLEAGIEPPGFTPGAGTDLWTPLQIDPAGEFYNNHVYFMVGLLAASGSVETLNAELARLTTQLPERFPNAYSQGFFDRYGFRTHAIPLKESIIGDVSKTLWILFGAVGLVLIVAAANVANLFVVRMDGQRRELAVRSALGAGRSAIARHVLAESWALSLAGGVLALVVGWWGVPALVRIAPETLPRMEGLRLGPDTVVFTLVSALMVGLGIAAYPLFRYARRPDAGGLVGGGRTMSAGRSRQRLRAGLVVAQVALALTLVAGAGLLVQSMRKLAQVDAGVDPEGVVTAGLFLTLDQYEDDTRMWLAYREILDRLEASPGVVAAGMTAELPISGEFGCTVQGFEDAAVYTRLEAVGMTTCAGQEPTTPGYFEALGIPLLQGRTFTNADNDNPATASVIVSRAFAERFWPGEDPLGKGVAPSGRTEGPFYRVVGVVGDVPARSLDGDPAIAIYYPIVEDPQTPGNWGWYPLDMSLVVRTSLADPISILPAIREAVRGVDSELPIAQIASMENIIGDSTARYRFTAVLLGVAAIAGLLLAAVGLYGVVSYIVSTRTREIGIRIAIGARPSEVRREVVRRSLLVVSGGLAVGLVTAVFSTRLMEGLLYGVEPTQPTAFLVAAALLTAIAGVASWIPARRAARVDPVEALRAD